MKTKEQRRQDRLATCAHFTGVPGFGGNPDCCRAGVDLRALVGGDVFGWARRLPCLPSGVDQVACDRFRARTEEEVDAEDAAWAKREQQLLQGLSGCCNAPIDKSQVITEGKFKGHGPRFCRACGKLDHMV